MADLSALSDEELEAEGFRLDAERAAAETHWKDLQLEQQAEVTRRSDARGGGAKQPEEPAIMPVEE